MERLPDGSYIIGGKDVAITGLDVNSGDVSIIVCIFNLIDLGLFFFVWMKHKIVDFQNTRLFFCKFSKLDRYSKKKLFYMKYLRFEYF